MESPPASPPRQMEYGIPKNTHELPCPSVPPNPNKMKNGWTVGIPTQTSCWFLAVCLPCRSFSCGYLLWISDQRLIGSAAYRPHNLKIGAPFSWIQCGDNPTRFGLRSLGRCVTAKDAKGFDPSRLLPFKSFERWIPTKGPPSLMAFRILQGIKDCAWFEPSMQNSPNDFLEGTSQEKSALERTRHGRRGSLSLGLLHKANFQPCIASIRNRVRCPTFCPS